MLAVIVKEKTIYPIKFCDIGWRSDSTPQVLHEAEKRLSPQRIKCLTLVCKGRRAMRNPN
jgi:hypothetical protein